MAECSSPRPADEALRPGSHREELENQAPGGASAGAGDDTERGLEAIQALHDELGNLAHKSIEKTGAECEAIGEKSSGCLGGGGRGADLRSEGLVLLGGA